MDGPTPMYCYQSHWLHEIYSDGLERSAKKYCNDLPYHGCIAQGPSRFCKESQYSGVGANGSFYCCPIMRDISDEDSSLPKLVTAGYRLYAKEMKDSREFRPVVEVVKDAEDGYYLLACRSFRVGEVITFVTKFEEEIGRLFLGGNCAKVGDWESECNSYLTQGRALRCTLPIVEGDEIVRLCPEKFVNHYFERLDRVNSVSKRMEGWARCSNQ